METRRADNLNRTVNIGDYVLCISKRYKEFTVGQIIMFTPKGAKIKYYDDYIYSYKKELLEGVFFDFIRITREEYEYFIRKKISE